MDTDTSSLRITISSSQHEVRGSYWLCDWVMIMCNADHDSLLESSIGSINHNFVMLNSTVQIMFTE